MSLYPVGERIVTSPAEAVTKRASIRSIIEGTAPLGTGGNLVDGWNGDTNEGNPLAYFGITPPWTRWFAYFWQHDIIERIHANHFTGATNLLVYSTGHNQRFFITPEANQRAFVRRMVNECHCDVLLISSPLQGENLAYMPGVGYPAGDTNGHLYLFTNPALAPATGTPLRYFLDAGHAAISKMIELYGPYSKIIVAGLSGGAQISTIRAAIDTRITHSYPVAGSSPFAERPMGHDNEQLEGVLGLGLDYPDLYLMASVDAAGAVTRPFRFIYGSDDPIFNRGWQTHWPATLDFARAHGWNDKLKVRVDYTNTHDISSRVADYIVADVLAT